MAPLKGGGAPAAARLPPHGQVVRRGPTHRPAVAFTFDDGPDPRTTLQVASTLEQAGARGTFFALAAKAARCGWVVQELTARGHEVALHGFSHRPLWTMGLHATIQQLRRAVETLEELTGRPVRYYRPPWGHLSAGALRAAEELGLRVVLWTFAPWDWLPWLRQQTLRAQLRRALVPGAIIDLHDAGTAGGRRALLSALPHALHEAHGLGLQAVTLSSLLG